MQGRALHRIADRERGVGAYFRPRNYLHPEQHLVDFTNMDDVKYVCENYKEKSLDKMELKDNPHPYIVFKRPVSSVHVRLFSTKDPQKSLWD